MPATPRAIRKATGAVRQAENRTRADHDSTSNGNGRRADASTSNAAGARLRTAAAMPAATPVLRRTRPSNAVPAAAAAAPTTEPNIAQTPSKRQRRTSARLAAKIDRAVQSTDAVATPTASSDGKPMTADGSISRKRPTTDAPSATSSDQAPRKRTATGKPAVRSATTAAPNKPTRSASTTAAPNKPTRSAAPRARSTETASATTTTTSRMRTATSAKSATHKLPNPFLPAGTRAQPHRPLVSARSTEKTPGISVGAQGDSTAGAESKKRVPQPVNGQTSALMSKKNERDSTSQDQLYATMHAVTQNSQTSTHSTTSTVPVLSPSTVDAALLRTRLLQWRYMNAQADAAWIQQQQAAERQLAAAHRALIIKRRQVEQLSDEVQALCNARDVHHHLPRQLEALAQAESTVELVREPFDQSIQALRDVVQLMPIKDLDVHALQSLPRDLQKAAQAIQRQRAKSDQASRPDADDAGSTGNHQQLEEVSQQLQQLHSAVQTQRESLQTAQPLLRKLTLLESIRQSRAIAAAHANTPDKSAP